MGVNNSVLRQTLEVIKFWRRLTLIFHLESYNCVFFSFKKIVCNLKTTFLILMIMYNYQLVLCV